jgi:putative Mg2+ transporter-C (MgtC) family protein
VVGLTTAASIWVVAAIGMAVGFGYFATAVTATVLVLLTLIVVKWVEDRVFPQRRNRRRGDIKTEPQSE